MQENKKPGISDGAACFLVKDKSLFDGWDSHIYEWLKNEGFTSWGKKGDCSRVDWVYINLNSKLFAPGIPGIKVTSAIGEHAITFEEFKRIYAIFKSYEGLDALRMSDKEQLEWEAKHIGERTVSNLIRLKGYVYVRLDTDENAQKFLRDAEAEGFTFGDGVKPTERETADIFALYKDKTLCYPGWAGHIAYGQAERIGDELIIRVDYRKYVDGESDYIIER